MTLVVFYRLFRYNLILVGTLARRVLLTYLEQINVFACVDIKVMQIAELNIYNIMIFRKINNNLAKSRKIKILCKTEYLAKSPLVNVFLFKNKRCVHNA